MKLIVLFYAVLVLLIAMNQFFGARVSEEFQFASTVVLLLVVAVSTLYLGIRAAARRRRLTADERRAVQESVAKKILERRT